MVGTVTQELRSEVGAVGPDDGAKLGVESDAREQRLVLERPKYLPVELARQVDLMRKPIGKGHRDNVSAQVPDARDALRQRNREAVN